MKPGEFKKVTKNKKVAGFIVCEGDTSGKNYYYRAFRVMPKPNNRSYLETVENSFDTEAEASSWIRN